MPRTALPSRIRRLATGRTAFLIYALLLLGAIAPPFIRNLRQYREVRRERGALDAEIGALESKNTELRRLLHYLSSDQFAEAQARYTLNFRKPGESVVVIKDPEAATAAASGTAYYSRLFRAPESAAPPSPPSNPVRWWRHFFN